MTSGDTKYSYTSNGSVDTVYILAKEVYFALIDNNIVSISISLNRVQTRRHRFIQLFFQNRTVQWTGYEVS